MSCLFKELVERKHLCNAPQSLLQWRVATTTQAVLYACDVIFRACWRNVEDCEEGITTEERDEILVSRVGSLAEAVKLNQNEDIY